MPRPAEAALKQANLLLNDRVFRIDVVTKPGEFSLDDASPQKIDQVTSLGRGEAVKKTNLESVKKRFLSAKAPEFKPVHMGKALGSLRPPL